MYKRYVKENKEPEIFDKVNCLQSKLNAITKVINKNYSRLSNKLIDPMNSSKIYCLTLKMFLNNKKILYISPLSQQNKYITDFKEKAEIFNLSNALLSNSLW